MSEVLGEPDALGGLVVLRTLQNQSIQQDIIRGGFSQVVTVEVNAKLQVL